MWLQIHTQGIDINDETKAQVDQRLNYALGRFEEQVGRITVHLVDLNGPRGGEDKLCRMVVELLGIGRMVVEDCHPRLETAIDRAADRMGQAVRRRIDHIRSASGRHRSFRYQMN